MNETSDNFMNISLLKSFTNGTWLNEWGGGFFDGYFPVRRGIMSSNSLNIHLIFPWMNDRL